MEPSPVPALPTDVPGAGRPGRVAAALRVLLLKLRRPRRLRLRGLAFAGPGVLLEVDRGARVTFGRGAWIGGGSRIRVRAGELDVGDGALLGRDCAISVRRRIAIGAGSTLGDRAMLVDFDHVAEDVERPIRLQGLRTAEVQIGEGARLGVQACVLRGVSVGAGAVVGPMAVVTRDVPAGALASGVPARPERRGARATRERPA